MEFFISSPASASICGVACALCACYLIVTAIRNVWFHPLAKFPGPKTAAASQIPYAIAALQGRLHSWIKELHDEYDSDIVRISPTELSFINASAWPDIYGSRQGRTPFEKDLSIYGKPPNRVDSLLTASRVDHPRMRRVLDHAFSDKAFKTYVPVVQGYVNDLISCLHDQITGPAGGRVDLLKWYTWIGFDIVGDLAFGDTFDCLKSQKYHPWAHTINRSLEAFTYMAICNRFTLSRKLFPYLVPKRFKKMIEDHWAATNEKVSQRLERGTERPDFMSPVITFNSESKGLTQGEIQSNASLFLIAGSDSVATILSGTTYYLLQNPAAMKQVVEEVLGAFESEAEINAQSVARLPYLLACLAETNRIYPTGLTGQAMIVPPEGGMIGGDWIPGGTGVTINMYAAYRSAKNFNNPDTYIPERWLGDPRFTTDKRDVFHPFSYGSRGCIGKNLGNLETRLIFARMIWNFDLALAGSTADEWLDQKAFFSWMKKPLVVNLSPRVMKARSSEK